MSAVTPAAVSAARRYRGGNATRAAERRELLAGIVREHLARYPGDWFSVYELARVIREQYLHEPPPPRSRYGYGRTNVLAGILGSLRDAGDVESAPGRRKGTTVWKAATR